MIKTITSWQITWDGSGKEKPVFAQCGPVMETGSCIGWPSTSLMFGKIAVSSLCLYLMKFLYWSGLSSMLHKFIYNPIPDIQRTAESSCRNTRWVYCFGLVFDNLNNGFFVYMSPILWTNNQQRAMQWWWVSNCTGSRCKYETSTVEFCLYKNSHIRAVSENV